MDKYKTNDIVSVDLIEPLLLKDGLNLLIHKSSYSNNLLYSLLTPVPSPICPFSNMNEIASMYRKNDMLYIGLWVGDNESLRYGLHRRLCDKGYTDILDPKVETVLLILKIDPYIQEHISDIDSGSVPQKISNIYSYTESKAYGSSNQPRQKEINMPVVTISLRTIKNLADKTLKGDLAELHLDLDLPEDISAHLQKLQQEEKENASREAATEIFKLLRATKNTQMMAVLELRELRKKEAQIKHRLRNIELARAYGLETNNYMPLACILGLSQDNEKVPSDWMPRNATDKAPKKVLVKRTTKASA